MRYVVEDNKKLLNSCDKALEAPSIVNKKNSRCPNKQMCKQIGRNQTEKAFDLINNQMAAQCIA